MEAETFEIVNNALRSNSKTGKLPIRYVCGVHRIVWSAWNHIVGPEVKFTWEAVLGDLEPWHPIVEQPCHLDQTCHLVNNCESFNTYIEESLSDSSRASVKAECVSNEDFDRNVFNDFGGEDDDRYIAMHTLCSEIYHSTSSDCVEFKVMRIPERRVAVASYIFRARHCDQQCINSIAFVISENRIKWFLKLQPFMEPHFEDLVIRLRTALLMDKFEEVLVRLTSELGHLLLLLGILENRSLDSCTFDIADTHFADPNLTENIFLSKCISAHLQCKGHTIVVGNFTKPINKMLKTLAFVTYRDLWPMSKLIDVESPDVDSAFEVLCGKDHFSPHLFLQASSKLHFHAMLNQAFYSRWPFCIIDVDESTVCDSLPFEKHLALRKEVLSRDLNKMLLREVPTKRLNISLKEHAADNSLVQPFLEQMSVLPYDCTIRVGFCLQFLRALSLRGLALDTYARVESEEGANTSNLKRSSVCKALNIKRKGDLMIILSAADMIRPDLAAFLLQSWVILP